MKFSLLLTILLLASMILSCSPINSQQHKYGCPGANHIGVSYDKRKMRG